MLTLDQRRDISIIEAAQASLTPAQIAEAEAEGAVMTLAQAVEYALQIEA
jgi:hypothetical protein